MGDYVTPTLMRTDMPLQRTRFRRADPWTDSRVSAEIWSKGHGIDRSSLIVAFEGLQDNTGNQPCLSFQFSPIYI